LPRLVAGCSCGISLQGQANTKGLTSCASLYKPEVRQEPTACGRVCARHRPQMAEVMSVLERLADTPPRELARAGGDGKRVLHTLFLQARAAASQYSL